MLDIRNADCLEYMKNCKDKEFDLAIVDPPYGIGAGNRNFISGTRVRESKFHRVNDWDTKIPDAEYWEQLFRVSKNQIVFGGNYMTDFLPPSRCWVFWDKGTGDNSYADGELAWTSFDKVVKKFSKFWSGGNAKESNESDRMHPTQKPIKLYEFLLHNYAEKGQRILDTHLGSGSSAIACHYFGCDFVGLEIDTQYYENAMKRIKNNTAQIAISFI